MDGAALAPWRRHDVVAGGGTRMPFQAGRQAGSRDSRCPLPALDVDVIPGGRLDTASVPVGQFPAKPLRDDPAWPEAANTRLNRPT